MQRINRALQKRQASLKFPTFKKGACRAVQDRMFFILISMVKMESVTQTLFAKRALSFCALLFRELSSVTWERLEHMNYS